MIVYHSRTGNTKRMAELIAEGARDEGAEVDVKPVREAKVEELPEYDAIVVGSPTYYGCMAAEVKKFLDDSVRLHGDLEGKVGGAFSSSGGIGGGNETTVMSILQALLIHGMIVQGTSEGDHYGPVAIGKPDGRSEGLCREYGRRVARLASKLASS